MCIYAVRSRPALSIYDTFFVSKIMSFSAFMYLWTIQCILVTTSIGLVKGGYPVNFFFLFLHTNICCGYSLEAPR